MEKNWKRITALKNNRKKKKVIGLFSYRFSEQVKNPMTGEITPMSYLRF